MKTFRQRGAQWARAGGTALVALAFGFAASTPALAAGDANAVGAWHRIALKALGDFNSNPSFAPGLPPVIESRMYAMAFTAMHDALNAIDRRYQPYVSDLHRRGADPNAAVAKSVHDVLATLLPPMAGYLDRELANTLASISPGPARDAGIALGAETAQTILTTRANDGSANPNGYYSEPALPGVYQPTFPVGAALLSNWGQVTPFVLTDVTRFYSPPDYKVTDRAYTRDYLEVKNLGGAVSTLRTADQSEIAFFWKENSPDGWGRIAQNLADRYHLNGWDQARLYALLQLAEADDGIVCLGDKYSKRFWRPITAIRNAGVGGRGDADGNPATVADPNWIPFDPVTPPVPDYPSNHASNGGAAEALLADFFGEDEIAFSADSASLPGVVRRFRSLHAAARENADSRVFIGYHFRRATTAGLEQGEAVGHAVYRLALRPMWRD